MSGAPAKRNPVEELAEEFLERYRRGERPALTEYVRRHPEVAGEIRDLFPALVMMEEAGPKSSAPAVSCSMPSAGANCERLGDYRILREVGRGGMGIVYEAEQEALCRHVALKVLPAQFPTNPTCLQRFRREARSAARLHHTNIVPVFDVGEFQGTHYYAMQFIQGQGLDEVLDELRRLHGVALPPHAGALGNGPGAADPNLTAGLAHGLLTDQFARSQSEGGAAALTAGPPLKDSAPTLAPPASVPGTPSTGNVRGPRSELSSQSDYHFYRSTARVGLQVAEALTYAHAQKVLHRDIKPSNLLLDLQGMTWVTDFGLAKEEGDDLTQTGDLVGTLRYMAPERLSGVSDGRSDVYSLGLTLYELLTLRPAFDETDRGRLIKRITHDEPRRPRKLDPRLPRDLETIVLKATAKEPRLRYQSADEMSEDLRRFLADRPIRARRSAVWEHAWRWCRRNPVVAGLSALAGVLLLIVAIGVPVAALLRNERDRALNAEAEARSAEKRALQAEGEGAFHSHLAQAAAYRHAGQVGQSFKSMVEVQQALALARKLKLGPKALLEVRNEAIACLVLPDLEVFKEWNDPAPGANFALDAAFQLCATSDLNGAVTVRRVSDHRVLCPIPGEGPADGYLGLEFSPDGRLLHRMATSKRSELFRLDGAQAVSLLDNHYSLAFRPDSRQFAAGYGDGSVLLFASDTGKELRRFATGMRGQFWLRWNPRAASLALFSTKEIRLLDLETGNVRRVPAPAKVQWIQSVTWHPHGRILAVAGSDARIYLCDSVTDRLVVPPLVGARNGGLVATFNHAGDRLLSTEWSGQWRVWDTRSGLPILAMTGGSEYRVQFSADDRLVAVGSTPPKVRLFRLRPGRELRTLMPYHHSTAGDALGSFYWNGHRSVDATGRLFAVPLDNKLALLDLRHGNVLATLPGDCVAFAADGSLWTAAPPGRNFGIHRWPVALDATTGRLRIGPPERVYNRRNLPTEPTGKVLAFPEFDRGAEVMHTETGRRWRLSPQDDVRSCAISPDDRWVATGSHWLRYGTGAKVWDIASRPPRRVKDLPAGGLCAVAFSPDRQWLLTVGGGPRLWKVGTWEPGPDLGGTTHNLACAFSADDALLALGHEPGVVRLVRPQTGEEVARLTAPVKSPLLPQAFTNDSAELITVGGETGALHIFDLRAIRTQLAERASIGTQDPYHQRRRRTSLRSA
jgi:serine/threonine protein kinase/WD40 repeat protein